MSLEEIKQEVMLRLVDEGYRFTNEEWEIVVNLQVLVEDNLGLVLGEGSIFDLDKLSDEEYGKILYNIARHLVNDKVIGSKKD